VFIYLELVFKISIKKKLESNVHSYLGYLKTTPPPSTASLRVTELAAPNLVKNADFKVSENRLLRKLVNIRRNI
jgi:hypothetical protein